MDMYSFTDKDKAISYEKITMMIIYIESSPRR